MQKKPYTFHLSLPLFRAALVPLWAMAPRSVRGAFSQDFVVFFFFSPTPQLLKRDFKSSAAPVKCSSPRSSFTPRSQVQVRADFWALRSVLRGRWRSCRFTNNCNPFGLTSPSLGQLCVDLLEVIIRLENSINTTQTLLSVQVTRADLPRDLGLTSGRGERCSNCEIPAPLTGLCGSLMPPKGINQSSCCLCSRRRIKP